MEMKESKFTNLVSVMIRTSRFHFFRGKARFVSTPFPVSFPFVSSFPAYIRKMRNEGRFSRLPGDLESHSRVRSKPPEYE
jgi:hypothetical protein